MFSLVPQTGACDYGVLASNLIIGSPGPGFPSYAPKIPHAVFVTGPQRNSQFRISEIYDLTECCCGPRQDQNSTLPQTFLHMQPLAGPRKSCCGPHEDQNLDVLNIMSTFVTFRIIKKPQAFTSKLDGLCFCLVRPYAFSFKNHSNYKLIWNA